MNKFAAHLIALLLLLFAGTTHAAGVEVLWHSEFGGSPTGQTVNALMELSDGGFIGAGGEVTYYSNLSDVTVFRMGPEGGLYWLDIVGMLDYDYAVGVAPAEGGNVRVLARMETREPDWSGLFQILYTSDGVLLGKEQVGDWSVNVGAHDFEPDPQGGYVAAGWAEPASGRAQAWLVKLGADGQPLWDRSYEFSENDQAFSVLPLGDGGYLLCGGTNYPVSVPGVGGNYGTAQGQAFLLRTDASGNELWRRTFGKEGFLEVCRDVRPATYGFILSGSWRFPLYKGTRSYLVRVDDEGNELWSYAATNPAIAAYGAEETEDGGFLHAGSDIAFGSNARPGAYVAKVSAYGNPLWHQSLNPDTVSGLWGGYLYGTAFEPVSTGGYLLGGSIIRSEPDGLLFRLGLDDGIGEPPPSPPPPSEPGPNAEAKLIAVRMKSGDAAAPLNRKSNGVTPATVLCTVDFDPADLDLGTVTLSGAPAIARKNVCKSSWEDVDEDGDLDLILFFDTREIRVGIEDDSLIFLGRTLSGEPVVGYVPVWIVQ